MPFDYCPYNDRSPLERLDALRDLKNAPPTPSRKGALKAQERGYCLEALLLDVMTNEGLDPKASYKPPGEQIDGSFVLDGRTLLLEAKWVKDPLNAATLYAFKGKVGGKLVGTVGLMLAMEGFSGEAIPALMKGKEVDVIAADGADLTAALGSDGSFAEMVRVKLRAAADNGVVHTPYSVAVNGTRAEPAGAVARRGRAQASAIAFVVEGPRDAGIVGGLGEKVLRAAHSSLSIDIHVGMGIENSIRLAASLREVYGHAALVGVVTDADDEEPGVRQARLGAAPELRGAQVPIVAAPPTIEKAWLGLTRSRVSRDVWQAKVLDALALANVVELRGRDRSFERFADLLEQHAASASAQ